MIEANNSFLGEKWESDFNGYFHEFLFGGSGCNYIAASLKYNCHLDKQKKKKEEEEKKSEMMYAIHNKNFSLNCEALWWFPVLFLVYFNLFLTLYVVFIYRFHLARASGHHPQGLCYVIMWYQILIWRRKKG